MSGPNIIVLMKQVPEMEKVRFDIETGRIDRSSAKNETNPFDLNALETAVQLKEKLGWEVIAISMGPPTAESTLRDALARGADRAILLTDNRFAGADTLATSYTLASAIKKIGYFDLIVCGEKTIDGDTGQVGPGVAENLSIPHVAYVIKVENASKEKVTVKSDVGKNYYLTEIDLPALIVVTKDVNEPRLPSLKDKLRSRKSKIEIWGADDLSDIADISRFGEQGSPTVIKKITAKSETSREGRIFRGKAEGAVREIVEALKKVGVLEVSQ